MKLLEIEIKNLRQIRHLQHKFSAGITGIFGPNGSGKSNLIRNIRANLTGDFGSDSLKERNVCRWATSKDAAYSRGLWQQGETQFELIRGLQRAPKQSLRTQGEPLTKARELSAELEKILGFSLTYAFEHLFVPQGKVFEFLSVKPEDRLRSLARLCHVDDLESLWSLLGDRINTDQKLVVQIDEDALIKSRQRYDELCKRLQSLQEDLDILSSRVLTKEVRKQHKLSVQIYEQRRADRQRLREVTAKYRTDKANFATHSTELRRITVELTAAREEIVSRQELLQQADQQLRDVNQDLGLMKQATAHQSTLEMQPPEAPVEPANYQEVAAARVRQEALFEESKKLESEIAALRKAPDSCPTCGHDWAQAKSHLQEKVDRLNEVRRAQVVFQSMSRWREYEGALRDYRRNKTVYDTNRSAAELWLREHKVPAAKVLREKRDAAAAVQHYSVRLADKERQLDRQHYSELNAVRSLRLSLIETQKQGRALKAELLQNLAEGREQYLAAKRALLESQQAAVDHSARSHLYDQLYLEGEALQEQIDKAEKQRQKTADVDDWLRDLAEYRAVVHRDQLPQIAMRAYLNGIVEEVNERLGAFDNPFAVSVAPDLSLLVEQHDGHLEPVSELSGGQKVVLAIAYHLTVNEHDFLALDEPTAGLDRTNLDYLANALLHLRGVAHKEGRQILLVTHDDRLERVFDDVIRLERPKEL